LLVIQAFPSSKMKISSPCSLSLYKERFFSAIAVKLPNISPDMNVQSSLMIITRTSTVKMDAVEAKLKLQEEILACVGWQFEASQHQVTGVGGAPQVDRNQIHHRKNASAQCSYHDPIFNGTAATEEGLVGVDRFRREGSGAQYALFVRADNGQLSTSRDCRCWNTVSQRYNE